MDNAELLAAFMDEKELSIIRFFLQHDAAQFYLREIARKADVSPASTYRILNKLVDLDILELQQIKTAKLYRLLDNKQTSFLKSIIEVDILGLFVQQVAKLQGVEQILQLGSRSKTKAKVMVIGEDLHKAQLKQAADDIKQQHNYTITYMTVSAEQFEQMSSMGLYPGKKKVLFAN